MINQLEDFKFEKKINLTLPILKSTILRLSKDFLPKHFFYTSKKFNTSLRVCNGPTKPISKIFDPSNLF